MNIIDDVQIVGRGRGAGQVGCHTMKGRDCIVCQCWMISGLLMACIHKSNDYTYRARARHTGVATYLHGVGTLYVHLATPFLNSHYFNAHAYM